MALEGFVLSFVDRLLLANESLMIEANRRSEDGYNFLTDSDLLDAAALWTTSISDDDGNYTDGGDDFDTLVEAIYAHPAWKHSL